MSGWDKLGHLTGRLTVEMSLISGKWLQNSHRHFRRMGFCPILLKPGVILVLFEKRYKLLDGGHVNFIFFLEKNCSYNTMLRNGTTPNVDFDKGARKFLRSHEDSWLHSVVLKVDVPGKVKICLARKKKITGIFATSWPKISVIFLPA